MWVDVLGLLGALVLVQIQEALLTLQVRLDVRLQSAVRGQEGREQALLERALPNRCLPACGPVLCVLARARSTGAPLLSSTPLTLAARVPTCSDVRDRPTLTWRCDCQAVRGCSCHSLDL